MLRRSFILLNGVGPKLERAIWRAGIEDWASFAEAGTNVLPPRVATHRERHTAQLAEAERHLARGSSAPVARWMPSNETWRALDELGQRALYLDIETTGLSFPEGRTTVVGMHRPDRGTELMVRGRDMDANGLQKHLDDASMIVTFNGRGFDMPFLSREFGVSADHLPHLDLMYACRRVGLTGGLKRIEVQLGLVRDDDIAGVDGWEAVRLWKRYERGDERSLETLMAYNEADVVNMVPLADEVYRRLVSATWLDTCP